MVFSATPPGLSWAVLCQEPGQKTLEHPIDTTCQYGCQDGDLPQNLGGKYHGIVIDSICLIGS